MVQLKRLLLVFGVVAGGIVAFVYAASEYKMQRTYDVALIEPVNDIDPDIAAGERMAKIVGCWAGCHGVRGEGGTEEVAGLWRISAPALGAVVPQYSDAELMRLVLRGIKRDGRSAIAMTSYSFWALGDEDLANIIYFLRKQPPAETQEPVRQISFASRLKLLRGQWFLSADWVDTTMPRWGNMPRETSYERGRYLAAIVCAECHGADYLGDPFQGGPPLSVLTIYDEAEFSTLMKTAVSQAGVPVESMSWLPDIEFSDGDVRDLYNFFRP